MEKNGQRKFFSAFFKYTQGSELMYSSAKNERKRTFTVCYNLTLDLFTFVLKQSWDRSNYGSMDQLAQSAQFYFVNSHFNQKSKHVKKFFTHFYTFKFLLF